MKPHPSSGVPRQPLHTRQVVCTGFLREDGLIDLEGSLLDTKHHDHDAWYKVLPAGAPVHRMRIVLTADLQFVIHNVEAVMDDAPTPYCPEIVAGYKSLIGLKVGPGFKKQMIQRVGGIEGCTHLTELLGPMATTLYQSTFDLLRQAEHARAASDPDYVVPKPWVIGTCHAHRADRDEVRKRWPDSASASSSPVRLITGDE
ncbi:DUF2889 domain-containing protein [Pseudomonas sp. PCH199]|uniref:DUF2889 domain-containing protein n=1 Tax=unclassified Pseudomonas TaxID=196821 RepID=UPI000BD41BDD|nr:MULTISPECIES: DUF2889 domain-containing protein [unclassified Pseudomonas]MCW8279206.1 DUF2889 domain-containing protein [Pseudomonas sp. PCH199]PAM78530.1 molybdopterin-guanine dinucleotide biosynthesis protein MobB [Pseudomonas sp. ERMR1:02]